MQIEFSPKAVRAIKKLPNDQVLAAIKALKIIAEKPDFWASPNVKKLSALPKIFRFRFRNMRIFFTSNGTILLVENVKKRDEKTYKNL